MKVTGWAKSVVGSRDNNQDSYLVWPERNLFAVADGVGGGMKGEVASRMAVEAMKTLPEGSKDLQSVFIRGQEAVLKESMSTLGEALMGTTLTTVLVDADQVHLCHAGDSRCYLYDGMLKQLTIDHEAYDETYGGPVLASYLGIPSDIMPLTLQQETFPVSAGNRLVLCSDGLYKQVTESRIAMLIKEKAGSPEALLEALCKEAAADPSSDNVTIVYVEID